VILTVVADIDAKANQTKLVIAELSKLIEGKDALY
jgi:hypothetical protein